MVKKLRKQKGITLVALIITIIVMLILAGVSISAIINGNILNRANEANQLNQNAVNRSEQDEANSLKQNYEEFNVDEKYDINGIEMYEYVAEDKIVYSEAKKSRVTLKDVYSLRKIDISLSQYIEKNGGTATVYFKADTPRTALNYAINNGLVYKYQTETVETDQKVPVDDTTPVEYEKITVEDAAPERKTILIKVEGITKDTLDGLEITIKDNKDNELYSLNFEYSEKPVENTVYIPTGIDTWFGKNYLLGNAEVVTVPDYEIKNESEIDEDVYISPKTSISEETTIETQEKINADGSPETVTVESQKYGTIKEETEDYVILNSAKYSSIQEDEDLKLYLVQEKEDIAKSKTMYLTDYKVEFYNSIEDIKFNSAQVSLVKNNEINVEYISRILGGISDIQNQSASLVSAYLKDNSNKKYQIISDKQVKDEDGNKFNYQIDSHGNINITKEENKITLYDDGDKKISDFSTNPTEYFDIGISDGKISLENKKEEEELKRLQDENYKICIKVVATDVGGKILEKILILYPTVSNFEIIDAYGATRSNEDYLSMAFEKANTLGAGTTIKQVVSEYIVNDGDDSEGFIRDGNIHIISDNLTYDLNGNTLTLTNNKQFTIEDDKTFNLKSSDDTNNEGNINFNHPNTFINETIIKYISEEDFLNRPEYAKFKDVGTYIEAGGFGLGVENNWWNRLSYLGLFESRKINAYLEYLHSFNAVGWNVNFKQQFSGVINKGIFNFNSGKIIVNTEEKVAAAGVGGGGVVLNVADVIMKFIKEAGVEVASITELTSSYAQIENTGVGIENHGIVTLGEDRTDYNTNPILPETVPHPEIEVNVFTEELAYAPFVGTFQNPNKIIGRNYGVWNKTDGATTNMYSGFMNLSALNKTTCGWDVFSVGKIYGIFNENGIANIFGITEKRVTYDLDIYGFITNNISALEDLWTIKPLHYGFFSYSHLELVSQIFGSIYYTNNYAIGYGNRAAANSNINPNIINAVNEKTGGEGYKYNSYQVTQNVVSYLLDFNTITETLLSKFIENITENDSTTNWKGSDADVTRILDGIIELVYNSII